MRRPVSDPQFSTHWQVTVEIATMSAFDFKPGSGRRPNITLPHFPTFSSTRMSLTTLLKPGALLFFFLLCASLYFCSFRDSARRHLKIPLTFFVYDSSTTLGPQETTNFIAEFGLDPVDAKSYHYNVLICLRLRLSTSRRGDSQAKHPVRAKVGFFLENAHEKYMTMKNENLRSNQGEVFLHLMTVRIPRDAKVSNGLVVLSLDQNLYGPPPRSNARQSGSPPHEVDYESESDSGSESESELECKRYMQALENPHRCFNLWCHCEEKAEQEVLTKESSTKKERSTKSSGPATQTRKKT
ncbi:hypothetical protein ACEPAH_1353 [Sanghuangporus vaninii]